VAVGAEVGADTTVGTVGSSAAGDSALHNDVVDHASVDVELGSLGVGLQVEEELADGLEGLLGPSTLGVLEFFSLGVAADASAVHAEWNNLLVLKTVFHVMDGSLKFHALGGTGHFVSVLVVGTQVRNSALSRYKSRKQRRTGLDEMFDGTKWCD
jgi:hypothetical protein